MGGAQLIAGNSEYHHSSRLGEGDMGTRRLITYHEVKRVVDDIRTVLPRWQLDDGGFPSHPWQGRSFDPSNTYTSAQVGLFLFLLDREHFEVRLDSLLRWVLEAQHTDDSGGIAGRGFGFMPDEPSDPIATALCLLLLTTNARLSDQWDDVHVQSMKAARDWLLHALLPDGVMGPEPGREPGSAFKTCFAALALADCLTIPDLYTPRITSSLRLMLQHLLKVKRRGGGWGAYFGPEADPVGTVYITYLLQQLQAVLRLTNDQLDQETSRGQWLLNHQLPNGSWEINQLQSAIEVSAGALITLLSAGIDPAHSKIQSTVRYLLESYVPHQGWPENPGPGQQPMIWISSFAAYALAMYAQALPRGPELPSKKAFIVHGHSALRREVAQLIKQLGYEAVILEEVPNGGLYSVLDKFEREARNGVDYVVVIYAEDDRSFPSGNVDLEAGYFIRALGRDRLCILRKGDLNLPSDLSGILFIDVDTEEAWKERLQREMVKAMEHF